MMFVRKLKLASAAAVTALAFAGAAGSAAAEGDGLENRQRTEAYLTQAGQDARSPQDSQLASLSGRNGNGAASGHVVKSKNPATHINVFELEEYDFPGNYANDR